MITLNDEIFKSLKEDLEIIINKDIKKIYDKEYDMCNIKANIGIAVLEEENEVTGDVELVPKIMYEIKNKVFTAPTESKIKFEGTKDYTILMDDEEEITVHKRLKAQMTLDGKENEEEKKKSCSLGKNKHQDITRCKNRENDSCNNCENYR